MFRDGHFCFEACLVAPVEITTHSANFLFIQQWYAFLIQ
jgi:hypothetical protein